MLQCCTIKMFARLLPRLSRGRGDLNGRLWRTLQGHRPVTWMLPRRMDNAKPLSSMHRGQNQDLKSVGNSANSLLKGRENGSSTPFRRLAPAGNQQGRWKCRLASCRPALHWHCSSGSVICCREPLSLPLFLVATTAISGGIPMLGTSR
jgi:hypothetical protein